MKIHEPYILHSMTTKTVIQLYKKYHVPKHVQLHMAKVAEISMKLAEKLEKNGVKVNKKQVKFGALFHDFFKVVSFRIFDVSTWGYRVKTRDIEYWTRLRNDHPIDSDTDMTADLLEKLDEPELAELVKKQYFSIILPKNGLTTLEEKIVYYADKRVMHTKSVTLTQRFLDGQKRYKEKQKNLTTTREAEKKIRLLEKELCHLAGIQPGDIN